MTKTLALLAILTPLSLLAQDSTLLAPTDALSPDEQRKKFHLPPGFEIQLVVCEPDIGQPMNLQFDAAGRLWVTSSVEYPYPAQGPGVQERDERFAGKDEPHPPRDWVAVISGIGPDGKPAQVVRFTEGLNIPIGHLPLADGALVYGIPSLDHHRDTDGDGVADERTAFLTGFGNVDTHGMVNGLRRWIDGWIYACHGFRNDAKVVGPDGRTLSMNRGNVFRFRPDGTELERFAWGQVNPFGLTFDALGNLYSADCHSKPLTCVLRGAHYSSFGKPHDGLGFGPEMIDHSHGSTGICGPAYYAATQFPADYRDNLFLCNPVTGRVHRDKVIWTGSSPSVDTQPDFITCDDGWFRPVDLTVGPDGALYLADFYNAIIGHYEMPLDHPKRDRSKGRVWRIVYVGEEGEDREMLPAPPDLTREPAAKLIERLGDDNLTVRVLASHELVDRHADEAVPLLKTLFEKTGPADDTATQRTHAMWVLERLGALNPRVLDDLSRDESRLIRTHAAKLIAERTGWSELEREIASRLFTDNDPLVRRVAVDAIGRHGDLSSVRRLLELLAATPAEDTHLVHTIRIALRNVMSMSPETGTMAIEDLSNDDLQVIAGVAPAVKTPGSAALLTRLLEIDMQTDRDPVSNANWPTAFGHVLRYGGEPETTALLAKVRQHTRDDIDRQIVLINAGRTSLEQRGDDPKSRLGEWATGLARSLLSSSTKSIGWSQPGAPGATPTWVTQERPTADGDRVLCWSSLPSGEQRIGALRSQPFELPASLSFSIAGHAGVPGKEPHRQNAARLRDAATGAILREAFPPRNDVAQPVAWDLSDVEGRLAYFEIEDGDDGKAYAWLAVGRFSHDGLNPSGATNPQRAAELIAAMRLESFAAELRPMLVDRQSSDALRAAAATALVGLDRDPVLGALVPLLADPAVPSSLKNDIAEATAGRQSEAITKSLENAVKTLPAAAQQVLADRLSESAKSAEALLALIEQGHASARLLTRPAVAFRLAVHGLGERAKSLTADLPAENEALQQLIESRTRSFNPDAAHADQGAEVFKKNCANCHRIGNDGSLIGPQLDGIGVRGLARVAEDILDSNRNVDGAFKTVTIVLSDGRVVTGLPRREEGASLVLADNTGKEFTIAVSEIEERVTSPLSLMPANFGEVLTPEQFADLMAYLLAQRQEKTLPENHGN